MLGFPNREKVEAGITYEAAIEALYVGILGRGADPGGLEHHLQLAIVHGYTIEQIAALIRDSDEHRDVMNSPRIADHTQHGELAKILKQIMKKGSKYDFVVDVGARGQERSNSYDLLKQFGWKGLLVEANPALYDSIEKEFFGLDFSLVRCAVGVEKGILPFYIGTNDDVSSLNIEASLFWGDIKASIEVEVNRLPEILEKNQVPYDFDLLSIDIESLDMPVFNDLIASSPYRPNIVVIEVNSEIDRTSMKAIHGNDIVCENYSIADVTASNVIAICK